jgi:hypothetical protein
MSETSSHIPKHDKSAYMKSRHPIEGVFRSPQIYNVANC